MNIAKGVKTVLFTGVGFGVLIRAKKLAHVYRGVKAFNEELKAKQNEKRTVDASVAN